MMDSGIGSWYQIVDKMALLIVENRNTKKYYTPNKRTLQTSLIIP